MNKCLICIDNSRYESSLTIGKKYYAQLVTSTDVSGKAQTKSNWFITIENF